METTHIRSRFDKDLQRIQSLVVGMAGLVGEQIADVTQALGDNDAAFAKTLIAKDAKINRLESKIDAFAVRLIALRQPMAADLRHAIVPIKISGELERIGDHAKAIALRATKMLAPDTPATPLETLTEMGTITGEMLKDGLRSYVEQNADLALDVHQRDKDVDVLHATLIRDVLKLMNADSGNTETYMHVLFIAKSFERIGDYICNLTEQVYFLVHGESYEDSAEWGHV